MLCPTFRWNFVLLRNNNNKLKVFFRVGLKANLGTKFDFTEFEISSKLYIIKLSLYRLVNYNFELNISTLRTLSQTFPLRNFVSIHFIFNSHSCIIQAFETFIYLVYYGQSFDNKYSKLCIIIITIYYVLHFFLLRLKIIEQSYLPLKASKEL